MPPIVAASAIGAGGGIISSLLGKSGQSKEQKASTVAQTGAMNSQSALARQVGDFSRRQYSLAEPAYSKALDYYTKASGAGGDQALQESLTPQYRQIGDLYTGAARGVSAGTMRGASKDVAMGNLNQQRVGQIADVTSAARTNAMGQLSGMGERGVAGAASTAGGAAGIYGGVAGGQSNLYSQALERQQTGAQRGSDMGASLFKLFMPWLQSKYGGGGPKDVPINFGTSVPNFGAG